MQDSAKDTRIVFTKHAQETASQMADDDGTRTAYNAIEEALTRNQEPRTNFAALKLTGRFPAPRLTQKIAPQRLKSRFDTKDRRVAPSLNPWRWEYRAS
jgi:hypothetical protein